MIFCTSDNKTDTHNMAIGHLSTFSNRFSVTSRFRLEMGPRKAMMVEWLTSVCDWLEARCHVTATAIKTTENGEMMPIDSGEWKQLTSNHRHIKMHRFAIFHMWHRSQRLFGWFRFADA